MIFEDDDNVRLTKSERNLLRRRNAANGETIVDVQTREQLLTGIIGGLPEERAREMLEFIEGVAAEDCGDRHA